MVSCRWFDYTMGEFNHERTCNSEEFTVYQALDYASICTLRQVLIPCPLYRSGRWSLESLSQGVSESGIGLEQVDKSQSSSPWSLPAMSIPVVWHLTDSGLRPACGLITHSSGTEQQNYSLDTHTALIEYFVSLGQGLVDFAMILIERAFKVESKHLVTLLNFLSLGQLICKMRTETPDEVVGWLNRVTGTGSRK